jgi:hypothetical protein
VQRQSRQSQIGSDAPAYLRQPLGERARTAVLCGIARLAPQGVTAILLAAFRVAPGGLKVAVRMPANPDVRVGRRHGKAADAIEYPPVRKAFARRVEVYEFLAAVLAPKSGFLVA